MKGQQRSNRTMHHHHSSIAHQPPKQPRTRSSAKGRGATQQHAMAAAPAPTLTQGHHDPPTPEHRLIREQPMTGHPRQTARTTKQHQWHRFTQRQTAPQEPDHHEEILNALDPQGQTCLADVGVAGAPQIATHRTRARGTGNLSQDRSQMSRLRATTAPPDTNHQPQRQQEAHRFGSRWAT